MGNFNCKMQNFLKKLNISDTYFLMHCIFFQKNQGRNACINQTNKTFLLENIFKINAFAAYQDECMDIC